MFKVSIPQISNKEIMNRYNQIKPIIMKNGKLHYLREFNFEEIIGKGYLWNRDEDVREEVGENELEVLEGKDFICLHCYGHYGLFNPSIGEILSQINEQDIPFVKAFEIIEMPETAEDFHKDNFTSIAFNNGYHVSTVRLYEAKR